MFISLPVQFVREEYLLLQGATALHITCQTSNVGVVEALVEHGAPLSFDAGSACKVKCVCAQAWLFSSGDCWLRGVLKGGTLALCSNE